MDKTLARVSVGGVPTDEHVVEGFAHECGVASIGTYDLVEFGGVPLAHVYSLRDFTSILKVVVGDLVTCLVSLGRLFGVLLVEDSELVQ